MASSNLDNLDFVCIQEDWVLCRVFYKNREVVAKVGMGSCYDDTGSSLLPALMDSYISFDQTQAHSQIPPDHDYEQVPCFSIFSDHQNQTNPIFNHITTMEPNLLSANKNLNAATYNGGVTPNLGSCLDPFSCDRKVLEAVLSQLTRTERNPHNPSLKGSPSLGEGSSESYLSDVGMPNIWNSY